MATVEAEVSTPPSDDKDTKTVVDRAGAAPDASLSKKHNKRTTGYEIRNQHGERCYFSRDSKDADARLEELAAQSFGTGLEPLKQPGYSLSEVTFIESVGWTPDDTDAGDIQARVTGPVQDAK